jgi:putative nucleotidyltransferase with HDIG domain
MMEKFISCNLDDLIIGEDLPSNIYVYINFKFITFRTAGDTFTRDVYDRCNQQKIRNLFVKMDDQKAFYAWVNTHKAKQTSDILPTLQKVREDAHRKLGDVFQSNHPDKIVTQTLKASKALVYEIMKNPFAVKSLTQLQTYSRGTVDHSLNVSILSTYLAMQMGYTHNVILNHIGMGGLLHDIGKSLITISDEDSEEFAAKKMFEHSTLGAKMLEKEDRVPTEVKLIIAQHHEYHDGSGYPNKLKGSQIYDLARIVSIANVFDEIVGNSSGSLEERQQKALIKIENECAHQFDPIKLKKAIKILQLGV